MNNKPKFIFFGTGEFAVGVLDTLIQSGYVPEAIITAPDRPKGRKMVITPPPVKELIINKELDIKILQPEKLDVDLISQLSAFNSQLFIVADYGKIIPKKVLEIPKNGALNVHPSLLPKFRGPSPIQSFLLSEEKETGVTIILLDEETDHGPIVVQETPKHLEAELPSEKLASALAKLGGELLIKVIPDWISNKIKAIPQDHNKATYTKKIKKEDGLINLKDLIASGDQVYKKFLAFTPWPSVYFFVNDPNSKNEQDKRVIITEAEIKNNKLQIKKVKPEGKNEITWKIFLKNNPHGHPKAV